MSDDEDDYVSFGKPLKELTEGENIRKRPISVEEQIATDENGKRRFHGAFTGGFSAGFFNTVDTPQGWNPAQFKSSKDVRTDRRVQKPEDFMDSDDFGEFGFAPHALKTTSKFQSRKEEVRPSTRDAALFAPVLNQLIQPAKSTIGETLLRKQGWKPGQGIGPKAINKLKKDRKESYVKTYLGESSERREEDDPNLEKYKEFLFAPDDLPVYVAAPKENFFGIGYRGLDRPGAHQQQSRPSSFNLKSGVHKKKFSISGEAFGVGAYEEDDDDIYNSGNMAEFDFSIDVEEKSRSSRDSRKQIENKSVSNLSDILEGFQLSTSRSLLKKSFPPPVIPREWKPKNKGYVRISRFEYTTEKEPVKISNPSRDQRRSMLFPDQARREEKKPDEVKEENPEIKEEPAEEETTIPDFISNPPNPMLHSGFKPFEKNPEKQTRYEQFLVCIDNNRREALKLLQPKTMTEWERERERVEFERAAHLYKPMKVNMASRFVSAGNALDDTGESGLGSDKSADLEKRKAAEMKMFGKLTRQTVEWIPARILCVRFNVKNPFGDNKEPENKKPKFGANQLFSLLDRSQGDAENQKTKDKDDTGVEDDENGTVPVKVEPKKAPVVLVKEEKDEIVSEKPSMDLFKAIFANSDSEDEEKEEETKKDEDENTSLRRDKSNINDSKPSPSARVNPMNADPARGIFAGINFDKFAKPRRKTPPPVVRDKVILNRPKSILDQSVRTILGIKSIDPDDMEYGPSLPPPLKTQEKIVISSDSDSDEWEEKSKKKKSKKKHKKEKKKKKKHHKSKKDY